MLSLSPAYTTHLAGEVTELATCWLITRRDAAVLGFTDHPSDLTVNGVLYQAALGYSATDVTTSGDLAVDNLNLNGFIDSPSITEADLIAGLWDYAAVEIFELIPSNLAAGTRPLRKGRIGEVSLGRTVFEAELRGLSQAFTQRLCELTSPTCRAALGDARCTVPLGPLTVTGTVTSVGSPRVWTDTARLEATDYFAFGKVTWTSGPNAGYAMEVKAHSKLSATGTVVLLLNGNGTNGSTTFTDSASPAKTVTANGNAQLTTSTVRYGTASMLFDGAGDFLTVPTSTDFDLGSTYTIEFWINPTSVVSPFGILHRGFYTASGGGIWSGLSFSIRSFSTLVRFYFWATTNANEQYIDTPPLSAGVWTHVAMVRNGTNGTVYFNGTSVGTISGLNTNAASTETLRIGRWDFSAGNEDFNGVLDDVRITRGGARYTGNFTPPTAELTASAENGGVITMQLPMPYAVAVGHTYSMVPGCDKLLATCIAKFSNVINFRGEPHLPGNDAILRGPG